MNIKIRKHKTNSNQSTMWGIKESIYKRQMNILRSAQQKYARRCNWEKMMQVSLEMAHSGYSRAAYDYLSTIMVEDKFPNGANYLTAHATTLKQWKKLPVEEQYNEIAEMTYNICHTKSDRHPAYLARVALELAKSNDIPDDPELCLARNVETIILRLPKQSELPSSDDIPFKTGTQQLKKLLLSGIPANRTNTKLFEYFEKNWVRQAKSTARLYLYNLVARHFHKYENCCAAHPVIRAPLVEKVDLDDFVYDKHTTEGKKRKRGLEHFLKEGASIENPSADHLTRGAVKRKAEKIYLNDERLYGTKGANSREERKRIRRTFYELKRIFHWNITGTVLCQKPCGSKPRTVYASTAGGTFFVKGPYRNHEKLRFQVEIDEIKPKFGLIPMGMTIEKDAGLFYLCCLKKDGFENMNPGQFYNDAILMNLVKVLIFRAAYNVSDTNMRNVMVNPTTNEVLSVDEMTSNRTLVKQPSLTKYLFTKVPKKMFRDMVSDVIQKNREEVRNEVNKYGTNAKHLLEFL